MTIFVRSIPLLLTLAFFALFAILLSVNAFFWPIIAIFAVVAFLGCAALLQWRTEDRNFWHYLATLVVFLGAGVSLLVFVSGTWLGYVVALLIPALSGWYAQNLFWLNHEPQRYQLNAIEHITSYLLVLSSLFLFSSLFASRVFFSLSLSLFFLLGTVFAFLVFFQGTWLSKKDLRSRLPFVAAGSILCVELLGVTGTLPTSFLTAGFLMMIFVYGALGLFHHALNGTLERKEIQRYSVVCGLAVALILVTAPWT